MSVLIGHACVSENGTINGAKGDSTGREVCTRSWYSSPWDYMALHPDMEVREKHAKSVEDACANNNIGYGRSDRNTLNTHAKNTGYDLSKVGKCNCDCSSLQNVAAVASGAAGVSYGSNGWTTSTMKAALQKAGYKIITDRTYLENAAYCVRGAIYVKISGHTACGLSNGASYTETLDKAGIDKNNAETKVSTNIEYTEIQFIKDVQTATNSKVDGKAGNETIGNTVTVSETKNRKHPVVVPLQKRLNSLGYDCGEVDGIAGKKFTEAVNRYQKEVLGYRNPDGEITARNKMWKSLLGMI